MEGAKKQRAYRHQGDANPKTEGLKKLVISMNPDRRQALDYDFTTIAGMRYPESPVWIKKNFNIRGNEHRKHPATGNPLPATFDEELNLWTSLPEGPNKAKNRMGCFGAHCRALEYVAENKIDNIAILEDDAQIDRKSMNIDAGGVFDTSEFPQDAPMLLGATMAHPKSWGQDQKWKREELPHHIKGWSKGPNQLDYDKMRWSQAHAIYYPTHQVAQDTLDRIKGIGEANTKQAGSGPYKHYDLFMGENRLVPYFHYPSVFTHNDGIDKDRQPLKKVGSSIGKGEGIVKDYINLGKTPQIIMEHTPPYEWKKEEEDATE